VSSPPFPSLACLELRADRSTSITSADLEQIIAYGSQPHVKTATVVGGGLLGLEAAKAAYDMTEIESVS
jgi:nitrite reductase (NAD(P)H)